MENNIVGKNKRRFQYMLDDFNRQFPYKFKRSITYVKSINESITKLQDLPSANIASHQFYQTLRDLTTDLLTDWNLSYTLNPDEQYLLHNCILFFNRLVDSIKDVVVLSSWLLDQSFINAITDCMSNIDQLLSQNQDKHNFKQLTRLFDLFSRFYHRLPSHLRNNERYDHLFEATMTCLTSSSYDRTFRRLKPHSKSMKTQEKFFLIQCPSFLSSKHTIQLPTIIEQLLETMVPRYASILNKHIKSIQEWNSAVIHAVHHLLLTVIFVKGHYTSYAHGQPLLWLIDHVICIINQSTIVEKVNENSTTCETLLIDSALKVLTVFVRDPDLLIYMKQLKIQEIFRSLILSSYDSIVFHSYIILSYVMDEDDIKVSEKESGRFLSNIFDSFRRQMKLLSETKQHDELLEHNISLIVEAIQVLVQHDQIKSEILKQNALPLLINNFEHINEKPQRLILESLGSMTFDAEAARLLRENTQFISSVKNIQDTSNDGIRKAAEKIIWNLIKEPEKVAERKERKKKKEEDAKSNDDNKDKSKKEEYEYDIMISYCHADKELVHQIHRFLADQGFKIWIDRDQMYGPAMQAMAEAVENSEFVILCMSDSYKRSVYCQAEAEYAFQCKRRLLPLIVRQKYRADGWLGLLLGSRIYIDFGRFDFKQGCESLLNEINLQRKSQLNNEKENGHSTASVEATDSAKSVPSDVDSLKLHLPKEYMNRNTRKSTYRHTPVHKWINKDILDFLFDYKLYLMMPLCESLNGRGLEKFLHMCLKKPTKLYSQLVEELRSRFDDLLPIGIFTQFLTEVEQIFQPTEDIQPSASPLKSVTPSPPPKNIPRGDTATSVPAPSSSPRNTIKDDITTFVPITSPSSKNAVIDDTTTAMPTPSPPSKSMVKDNITTSVPTPSPSPKNTVKDDITTSKPSQSPTNSTKSDTSTSVSTPSSSRKNTVQRDTNTSVPTPSPSPRSTVKGDVITSVPSPSPSSKNTVKDDITTSKPSPSPTNSTKSDTSTSVSTPSSSRKNTVQRDTNTSVPTPSPPPRSTVKGDTNTSVPAPLASPKNTVKGDVITSVPSPSPSPTNSIRSDTSTSVSTRSSQVSSP